LAKQVPISSRDNHRIHADVLKADLSELFPALAQDPSLLPEIQAKVVHWAEHFEAALLGGAVADEWEEDKTMLDAIQSELAKLAPPAQAEPDVEGEPAPVA